MLSWIKANPLYAGIILVVALAIIAGAYKLVDKWHSEHETQLINQGATEERSKSNAETINAVENAQRAADRPTHEQLNVVCGKYDRNCPHGS